MCGLLSGVKPQEILAGQRRRLYLSHAIVARFVRTACLAGILVALVLTMMPGPAMADSSATATAPVSAQIESIGQKFTDSYEGRSVGQDGVVTVFATAAGSSEIGSALSTADIPASAYKLVSVAHSLQDLQNLTMKLNDDQDSLRAQGINLVMWGPAADPSSDTVSAQITDYTAAAATSLQNQYGGAGWISVQPWTGPAHGQLDSQNRYYDARPFNGGDRIFGYDPSTQTIGTKCTSGFTLVGNKSGNLFTTMAGHCENEGIDPIWTNLATPTNRGYVDTNYLLNGDQFDVASFDCNCTSAVWHDDPNIGTGAGSAYSVIGWCDCDPSGDSELVTFDGATTGQVPDAVVDERDVCTADNFFGDGYKRCFMNRAKSTSTICQGGDSGGPVYQRAPNGTVYATGMIIGDEWVNGTEYCWYARMRYTLSLLNVSLLEG